VKYLFRLHGTNIQAGQGDDRQSFTLARDKFNLKGLAILVTMDHCANITLF
jgi:hypothetical protein